MSGGEGNAFSDDGSDLATGRGVLCTTTNYNALYKKKLENNNIITNNSKKEKDDDKEDDNLHAG